MLTFPSPRYIEITSNILVPLSTYNLPAELLIPPASLTNHDRRTVPRLTLPNFITDPLAIFIA